MVSDGESELHGHPGWCADKNQSRMAACLQLWPGGVESRLYPVYSGGGGSDSVITPFYRSHSYWEKNQCSPQVCLPSLHSPVDWLYTSELWQVLVVFSSPLILSFHWLFRHGWKSGSRSHRAGFRDEHSSRAVNHYSLEPSWLHSHKSTSSFSAKKTLTLLSKSHVE